MRQHSDNDNVADNDNGAGATWEEIGDELHVSSRQAKRIFAAVRAKFQMSPALRAAYVAQREVTDRKGGESACPDWLESWLE